MKKGLFILVICLNFHVARGQWETVFYPTFSNLPWLSSVVFYDFNNGLAVGDSTGSTAIILKTTDNGTNWTTVFNSSNGYFYEVVYVNQLTAFAVGGSATTGFVAKSIDGGNTWSLTNLTSSKLTSISFPDSIFGYACGMNGTMLKTTNAGSTWTPLSTPTTNFFNEIVFINDTVGFACGDTFIIKTTDGGISWSTFTATSVNPGTYLNATHLSFPSQTIGYFLISDISKSYLYKTIDQGVNWNFIDTLSTSPAFTTSICFPNDTVGYISGQFQMHKTIDGGSTWINQTANPPGWANFYDDLMDVYFINQDTGFAVGANQFYRTSTGGVLGIETLNTPYFYSIFPNPSKGQFSITTLDNHLGSIAEIYNSLGTLIYSITLNLKHQTLNLNLYPGIYIIKINNGAKSFRQKLIVD